MSLDLRNESRSDTASELALAARARMRGAPLLDALERRSPGARERADAMGSYAFAAAVALELGRPAAELCRETAKLADVGRLYDSDAPQMDGARLALGAGVPSDICDWILQLQERFDGGGPQGLKGGEIAIAARIGRAAGVCDEVLAEPGASPVDRRATAVSALRAQAGSELDPEVADALIAVLEATRR